MRPSSSDVSLPIDIERRIAFRPLKSHAVSMAKDAFVQCRVSSETKAKLRALASEEHITESAILNRVLERGLFGPEERPSDFARPLLKRRSKRLYIRLSVSDRDLLQLRADARCMAEATYVSLLLHSHLESKLPLPKAELAALHCAIAELSAIGRNLWQLIRMAHAGAQVPVYSTENARSMLEVCSALRQHIKDLLEANAASWGQGGTHE